MTSYAKSSTVAEFLLEKSVPAPIGTGQFGAVYDLKGILEHLEKQPNVKHDTLVIEDSYGKYCKNTREVASRVSGSDCVLLPMQESCMVVKFFKGGIEARKKEALKEISSMMIVYAALPDMLRHLSVLPNPMNIIEVTMGGAPKEYGVVMRKKIDDAWNVIEEMMKLPQTAKEDVADFLFDMSVSCVLFMGALHDFGYVHHDAKIENIVSNETAVCVDEGRADGRKGLHDHCVSDYGMVCRFDEISESGTPPYMSPLLLEKGAKDMWQAVGLEATFDHLLQAAQTAARSASQEGTRSKYELLRRTGLYGEIDFHSIGASIMKLYAVLERRQRENNSQVRNSLVDAVKPYFVKTAKIFMYPFQHDVLDPKRTTPRGITPALMRLSLLNDKSL